MTKANGILFYCWPSNNIYGAEQFLVKLPLKLLWPTLDTDFYFTDLYSKFLFSLFYQALTLFRWSKWGFVRTTCWVYACVCGYVLSECVWVCIKERVCECVSVWVCESVCVNRHQPYSSHRLIGKTHIPPNFTVGPSQRPWNFTTTKIPEEWLTQDKTKANSKTRCCSTVVERTPRKQEV